MAPQFDCYVYKRLDGVAAPIEQRLYAFYDHKGVDLVDFGQSAQATPEEFVAAWAKRKGVSAMQILVKDAGHLKPNDYHRTVTGMRKQLHANLRMAAKTSGAAHALRAVDEASWYLAVLAMSMDQALSALGFRPGERPSESDVKKAWQKKAMEFHPDRGGDPEKMKEVNVARDVLLGERRQDKTFSGPGGSSPTPYTSPGPSKPYTPPKKEVVTLEEALRPHASKLSGVEWLFVTTGQRGSRNYSGDESSRSEYAHVVVGKDKNGGFVAVGLMNVDVGYYYVGGGGGQDKWYAVTTNSVTLKTLTSSVSAVLKALQFDGRFNNKVLDARGHSDMAGVIDIVGKGRVKGESMSIKNWLVQSGLVAGDDPSVANRKHTVEVRVKELGIEETKRWLVVVVDGKAEEVSDADMKKVRQVGLFRIIFGTYYYNGSHKMLTKSKNGPKVMAWLAKHMDSLSPESKKVLEALGTKKEEGTAA